MKLLSLLLFVLLVGACRRNAPAEQDAAPLFREDWAADALWDDGQAEVATYAARREVYGKVREYEYTFITVKEEFNTEHGVKTDDYTRSDLYPVLKINKFARLETDNYPYHYLTSLFYKRNEPGLLHKMTHSSQEWCGNTFKLFQQEGRGYQYLWSSYWDGQGDGREKLTGTPLFEDGLSHSLRALPFAEGLQFARPVLESQISNKATPPATYQAHFTVSSSREEPLDSWQVQVQLARDKTSHYWFAKAYPHILLRMQSWDGQELQLQQQERRAYW
ncbi:hypothetical protein [Cesiribacter andamanensis]|uniref:Uncharacterized protein n=1 Tax=Cesiribacter andamanensis AMV16 TaxID=1279009 RepID=M7MWP6_9BACT|nr:hypothetical protein [Cesiribacter andamanensis]EMR00833.1 hypothetical protein ADICEAN_04050 [Cesiribacter andamanensis AMV16]